MSANWHKRNLGELITVQGGFAFKNSDFEDAGIPIVRMSDLKAGHLDLDSAARISEYKLRLYSKFKLHVGDFLVGMSGSIGNYAIVQEKDLPAYLNQRVGRFQLINDKLSDYDFITQIARSNEYKRHIEILAAGAAQVNISPSQIESFQFDLPPKSEQTQIAKILSTLDQAIEQTEAIIAKQERIKTGLMQDLLTKGIDENGNVRSEATHKFKDSLLGRIPVEWDTSALSRVADISAGITLGKNYEGPNTIELPYLRVANVQDGYLNLSDIKTIKLPLRDLGKYRLEEGDVLMNEGGDFDKLGRGTVWLGQIQSCLHQNHVFKVRPNADKLLSNFLTAISASPYGKAFFMLASKQSTNLASINSTQLKAFLIPLPPLTEQKRICSLILTHQENVTGIQDQLSKLKSIKTGLMYDLLTGKVRVTNLQNSTLSSESL